MGRKNGNLKKRAWRRKAATVERQTTTEKKMIL